jgi:cysteine dioxygenase
LRSNFIRCCGDFLRECKQLIGQYGRYTDVCTHPLTVIIKPTHLSIEEFVSKLRTFTAPVFAGTQELLSFLQTSPVRPETLVPYLTWHPQHYTRNLIDKTPLYELLAICWEIGQASSVHNHRDQNCWMAAPIGKLQVQNYHVLAQDVDGGKCELRTSNIVEITEGHPCAVDPKQPVHRVINPREFNQRAVSLHVYSHPFDTCVVYSPEQGTCGVIKLHYTTEYGKSPASVAQT